MFTCLHIEPLLNPTSYLGKYNATRKLLKRHAKFDAIAVCGMSGALLGGAIAARMKKKLIVVRKPQDDSHSKLTVEYEGEISSFILLDDDICSGNTVRYMLSQIFDHVSPPLVFVGAFMWRSLVFHPASLSPCVISDVETNSFTDTKGNSQPRNSPITIRVPQ